MTASAGRCVHRPAEATTHSLDEAAKLVFEEWAKTVAPQSAPTLGPKDSAVKLCDTLLVCPWFPGSVQTWLYFLVSLKTAPHLWFTPFERTRHQAREWA